MKNNELINTIGGAINITGTLISAFVSGINAILDVGRSLGTAIRMVVSKRKC